MASTYDQIAELLLRLFSDQYAQGQGLQSGGLTGDPNWVQEQASLRQPHDAIRGAAFGMEGQGRLDPIGAPGLRHEGDVFNGNVTGDDVVSPLILAAIGLRNQGGSQADFDRGLLPLIVEAIRQGTDKDVAAKATLASNKEEG